MSEHRISPVVSEHRISPVVSERRISPVVSEPRSALLLRVVVEACFVCDCTGTHSLTYTQKRIENKNRYQVLVATAFSLSCFLFCRLTSFTTRESRQRNQITFVPGLYVCCLSEIVLGCLTGSVLNNTRKMNRFALSVPTCESWKLELRSTLLRKSSCHRMTLPSSPVVGISTGTCFPLLRQV